MTNETNRAELISQIEATENELAKLKQQLAEKPKWEPYGGDWLISLGYDEEIIEDNIPLETEGIYRAKTSCAAKRLMKHIKNATIMWQIAEQLNDGWVAENRPQEGKCGIFYSYRDGGKWCIERSSITNTGIFKNHDVAREAIDILTNYETGYEL